MKNDINLLYKRKTRTYSNKNIAALLIILILIGAIVYAGIALPSGKLQAEKIKAAEIENELKSSSVDKEELSIKTGLKAELDMQLAKLNALKETKADILNYIEVIESQRPSKIILKQILTRDTSNNNSKNNNLSVAGADSTIELLGVADSDRTIALFCLRLREQNVFKSVLLKSSLTQKGISSFTITLTLPSPLDSKVIIQNLEQNGGVASNAAPGGK